MRATFDPRVQLTGTGSCVGDRVIDNVELESYVHGYDEARSGPFAAWVDQVTHIHERPWAPRESRAADLGLVAAQRALDMAGVAPKELGLIIFASFTPSEVIPGDHCRVAHGLGADRTPSFNLMGTCAGAVQGLSLAYGMVASGAMRHVLVVAAEQITAMVNWHDPLTAILYGDGSGAAVISRVDDAPPGTGMLRPHLGFEWAPTAIHLTNSQNPHDVRCVPQAERPSHPFVERSLIEMSAGPSVLRNAINNMAECVVRVCGYEISDLKAGDPSLRETLDRAWLVPHQANGRIVEGLADKLSMSKVMRTVFRYGNMSAASSLVALDHGVRRGNLERVLDADGKVLEVRETPDRIGNGDTVLMPSIGGGYLMGCVGLRLARLGG